MTSRSRLLLIPAVLLLVLMLPAAASAQTRMTHPKHGTGATSSNWCGYDAVGGGFTSVTATWTQPAVKATSTNTYASFWVGLDGDGSSTVEQIGTEGYTQGGKAYYDVWYEMYPKFPVAISMEAKPGDTYTASVKASGTGSFTLTITNKTTGQTFTKQAKLRRAKLYSAEVIAEAPWSQGVLPLANFGTMSFTNCAFNGKPISAFDWTAITMASGGITKATPSALGSSGTSFSVVWKSY